MHYKLKSVKLWLLLILIAFVGFLTYCGNVTGAQYIDFIKWAFGIFTVGNVTSKLTRGTNAKD